MPNPKAGDSRWVPDIRPESIETVTETYTGSDGQEQTATYKVVPAHPILGGILDKLAFFRTHASAVWYNKLAGKTVKAKLDEVDQSLVGINAVKHASETIEAVLNTTVYGAAVELEAGHTYLLLSSVAAGISAEMLIANRILIRSGQYEDSVINPQAKCVGISGACATSFALIETITNCIAHVSTYGYYDGSYNFSLNMVAIKIR